MHFFFSEVYSEHKTYVGYIVGMLDFLVSPDNIFPAWLSRPMESSFLVLYAMAVVGSRAVLREMARVFCC